MAKLLVAKSQLLGGTLIAKGWKVQTMQVCSDIPEAKYTFNSKHGKQCVLYLEKLIHVYERKLNSM